MSIKKIAVIAGVSTATVSRVLNNPDYKCSSEELREKIWQIAREMNYMPNEAARNLKMGKSTTKDTMYYLDILMTRTGNNQEDPFFSELLRIIESQIHKRSCILVSLWHQPIFSNERKCLNKYRNRYYVPSIIASDDIEEAQYTQPMLTTVRLPREEMGKFTIDLLLDRLSGGHKAIVRTELEGNLMIRESCTSVENTNRLEYYI